MKENKEQQLALGRQNLILLAVSFLVIIIGFILMSGNSSGVEYNPDIYSFRRIIVAPMVLLAGFLLVIFAILWKKPKKDKK